MGLETVPCIIADDLTPEQIKAFRLADNKVGELAEWDFAKLEALAKEVGFTNIAPMDPKTIELKPEVRQMCEANTSDNILVGDL